MSSWKRIRRRDFPNRGLTEKQGENLPKEIKKAKQGDWGEELDQHKKGKVRIAKQEPGIAKIREEKKKKGL